MTTVAAALADPALAAESRLLWDLCYRMTGVAADADDLVQDTFLRALERPPADTTAPLRPWLVRVAMNLARDLLRRRRRRPYVGPWLPSPVETPEPPLAPEAVEPRSTEGRYDLIESASYAFLLALEALTPLQRAVLLLRDVCDYSVRETAWALDVSEGGVKAAHHRARRAMAAYDRTRRPPTRSLADATRAALAGFLGALAGGDASALEALLARDVRLTSDSGGEFHAARKVVVGPTLVARFFAKLTRRRGPDARLDVRIVNGLPAMVLDFGRGRPGDPPRGVIRCELDADGRIAAFHAVLATRKLTAVR